jgi:hypothetical protein
MNMTNEITDAWAQTMTGTEIDVPRFVDELLAVLQQVRTVAGRLVGDDAIEIMAGATAATLRTDAPRSKLRMTCARLAVVFRGESPHPPALYGDHLTQQVDTRGGRVLAELEMKNTAAEAWFVLRLVS